MIQTVRPRDPVANRYEAPALQPVERIDHADLLRLRQEEARREGFEAGYEAGMTLAEAEVNAMVAHHQEARYHLEQAARALLDGVEQLRTRDALAIEAIEADVVGLAVALATELIGRELAATAEPVRDSIARALRLVPDRGVAVAHVHPDDVDAAIEAIGGDIRSGGSVEVLADERIERGGCVMEVGDCRIDAQIGPAIERMRDALVD